MIYLRCPIRFSYCKSEGVAARSAFRFDLFLEKSQTTNRFNAKGFTENFRNFDETPTSAEFSKISPIENFFISAHIYFWGITDSNREKASFHVVKTLPVKSANTNLSKKPVISKPQKKVEIERKVTLALGRGFVNIT